MDLVWVTGGPLAAPYDALPVVALSLPVTGVTPGVAGVWVAQVAEAPRLAA